MPMVPPMNFSI